jgi:hypothetical protein
MITTYTDTLSNVMLDVSPAIDQLTPHEAPFLSLVGKDSLRTPCTQVTHTWLEDEDMPRVLTLASAYTAGDGQIIVTSTHEKRCRPDDLIIIGRNVMRIMSGPPDSTTFIVEAGLGASSDASAAAGATVTRLSHAAIEGATARTDAVKVVVGSKYNYPQIMKDWTLVTGTMEQTQRYGYASERAYCEEKLLRRMTLDFEHHILYGARSLDTSGNQRWSSMGGLKEFVLDPGITGSWATVVDGSAGLTETLFNDMMQYIHDVGGEVDTVMVTSRDKRRISSWASPRIRTTRDERTAGDYVDSYESDFGTVQILPNRNLLSTDMVFCLAEQVGLGPYTGRQMSSRPLATTADGVWFELMGEYTMEVHRPNRDFGWIYDLT